MDDNFNEISGALFEIKCDTILMSVGLIPENELIDLAGLRVDGNKMPVPGIFMCGNCLKIYDLVDGVTQDSSLTGKLAAEYIDKRR